MLSPSRMSLVRLTLFITFAILLVAESPDVGHAHGLLTRSEPAAGSILASSPSRVELWFSENLDGRQSVIEVYASDQQRVDAGDSAVDSADATHLTVSLHDLADGVYTVSWRSSSTEDGHAIRGTYSFQIGQGRLPAGAVTIEGRRPATGATFLRWGTIFGLSLVAGWFLLGLLTGELAPPGARIASLGAMLALFSDLLALPVLIWWGDAGARSPNLGAAFALMSTSWYWRVGLELALALLVVAGTRNRSRLLILVGAALGAAAVLSLTFSSHAAADSAHRLTAIGLNAIHLESVTFWLGGLAQLAFVYRRQPVILRRFSRLAVPLFIVALVSGIGNAGLILAAPSDLWRSAYGQTLLVKTAIVLLVLGTAWFNRRMIGKGAFSVLLRVRTLRLELALGAAAVLVAAILALSAIPGPVTSAELHLRTNASNGRLAHLSTERADAGRRDYIVWLSGVDNVPVRDVIGVDASFSMLERTVDLSSMSATQVPDGRWVLHDVPVTIQGWWQATLLFRDRSGGVSRAQFALLLPDPSLVGYRAIDAGQADAEQLFERTFANLLSLTSMRSSEVLADGIGNSVSTNYEWAAPDRLGYVTSGGNASVAIGSTQFFREGAGPWESRQRVSPVNFPLAFEEYYSGADQIRLGRQLTVDRVTYQLLTFHVPAAPRRDQSWYAWWIDTSTGQVEREAMAAKYHYMDSFFHDINAPIQITAPDSVGSP